MINGWTVALVTVLVLGALGVLALLRGTAFRAAAKLGPGGTGLSFEVSERQRLRAVEATHDAGAAKGDESGVDDAIGLIRTVKRSTHRRLLWVDDLPDNNIYESTVLQSLGYVITAATTTEAGLSYLASLDFDIVLTDMRRGERPLAGVELLQGMRERGLSQPVVVYMGNVKDHRAAQAANAGAAATFDAPGELIAGVLRLCPPSDEAVVGRDQPQ
jgi:CheY-like chemotaxis protein